MNKKLFWASISLGVIVFVAGPLFVQYNHWPKGSNGNGDWLSFWGSYLGVIPSGLIAYCVAKVQINAAKESERLQRNENHYLNELRNLYESLVKLGQYKQMLMLYRENEINLKRFVRVAVFIKDYDNKLTDINLKELSNAIKIFITLMPRDGNKKIVENGNNLTEEINKIDFYISWYRNETIYEDGRAEIPKYLSDLKMVDNLLKSINSMSDHYDSLEAELISEIKHYSNIGIT